MSRDRAETPLTAILTGPTATGKTGLALELARAHPEIEIVNADSLLVYRGMDIGTAKPAREERAQVPHHLIDIREPDEPYTAGDFYRDARAAIGEIHSRGKRALVAGGTGFYLKALLYGLWEGPKPSPEIRARLENTTSAELYARLEKADPQSAARIGPNDRYRLVRAIEVLELTGKTPTELQKAQPEKPAPDLRLFIVDRKDLSSRISARARSMLEEGLLDETRRLRERFPGARSLSSVGYAETCRYLDGQAPDGREVRPGLEGLREEIELATRQLVKKQRTWFRNAFAKAEPFGARWLELPEDEPKLRAALEEVYAR